MDYPQTKLEKLEQKIREFVCLRADLGDISLPEAIDLTIQELDDRIEYWSTVKDQQPEAA